MPGSNSESDELLPQQKNNVDLLLQLRKLLSCFNYPLIRSMSAIAFGLLCFIYNIYAIINMIGLTECGMEEELQNKWVVAGLAASGLISLPGAIDQTKLFTDKFFPDFFADAPRQRLNEKGIIAYFQVHFEQLIRSHTYKKFSVATNQYIVYANGWFLAEQLSKLWSDIERSSDLETCIQEYWTKHPESYIWRLSGMLVLALLQYAHTRFYFGSQEAQKMSPKFCGLPSKWSYIFTALLYSFGSFLITGAPVIRYFITQKGQKKGFTEEDLVSIIKLVIGLIMVPVNTIMYHKIYKKMNIEANKNQIQGASNEEWDTAEVGRVIQDHTSEEISKEACPIWIRQVLIVLLTAGATGYQYYLCYLGLIAVANDFSKTMYSENSIPTWLRSLIIGEVALSSIASFCRRVINVAF